jgi:hypothetical protein
MKLTKRVELVFPRSGQTLAVNVPVELFETIMRINATLLSITSYGRALIPNELLTRVYH